MSNEKVYIGVDNGVTGTIGVVHPKFSMFMPVPVKKQQDYTKKKKGITRVDVVTLHGLFKKLIPNKFYLFNPTGEIIKFHFVIERPMVNPSRWTATLSAIRCLEAWLIFIESMGCSYEHIDSKQWQKELLPKGITGKDELKKASACIGKRLFPGREAYINRHKDADGLLIAEWARRHQL